MKMEVPQYRCPCCKRWTILFRNRNKDGPRTNLVRYYVRCPNHGDLFLIAKGRGKPQWLLIAQRTVEIEVEE